MKLLRTVIVVGSVMILAGGVVTYLFFRSDDQARLLAEKTRLELKTQGYKVDLSEFTLSTSDEMRARAKLILGGSAAPPRNSTYLARDTILTGPIAFDIELDPHDTSRPTISVVASLLELQMEMELRRQHNEDRAFTNLLAATRLALGWKGDALEISHKHRWECIKYAVKGTTYAMEHADWSDERWAALQREWERAEVLQALPETAALARAASRRLVVAEESGVPQGWAGFPQKRIFNELFRAPVSALRMFSDGLQRTSAARHYHDSGRYEEETALLRYFRQREDDIKKAVACRTWSAMREFGVASLQGTTLSSASTWGLSGTTVMNRLRIAESANELLSQAAEAETRRRLAITAVALTRYKLRHGSFPKSLSELASDFVKEVPVDFMDGKPLRYRVTGETFLLYSVGLNLEDEGGKWPGAPITTPDLPWPKARE